MEYVLLLLLVLTCSAFFSGLEFAFISADKLRVALQKKREENSKKSQILSKFYEQPTQFLGTILIGNNIALVLFSLLMAEALQPFILNYTEDEFWLQLVPVLIATPIILLTGEFIPKTVFRLNPSGILSFFAIPFSYLMWILSPVVRFTVWVATSLLRIFFGIKPAKNEMRLGKIDLQNYVNETNKAIGDDLKIDTTLFSKALALSNTKVRECMVPRPEIVGIDQSKGMDIARVQQAFIKAHHSKLVVYNKSIDNVKGYVHHQDVLANNVNGQKLRIWDLPTVPETLLATDLMNIFINKQRTIAWVIDEFGGTAGIVTMEDIMEEVFGEIYDEHDAEKVKLLEEKTSNGYLFSGRWEIDYLNENYGLKIPQGDYETLAGYVLNKCENMPLQGYSFENGDFIFNVAEVTATRIEKVEVTTQPKTEA